MGKQIVLRSLVTTKGVFLFHGERLLPSIGEAPSAEEAAYARPSNWPRKMLPNHANCRRPTFCPKYVCSKELFSSFLQ
jgi:hypothetical protein